VTDSAGLRPWRCFVAVALPSDLRAALAAWVADVRHDPALDADWRWADPDGWHVTLAFLGATPPDQVGKIVDRLAAELAGWEGFAVRADGIGGFPGRSRARVLWYGVRDEQRRLADLAHCVRAACGVDETAPFRAHVTLARARDRQGVPLPPLAVEELPAADVPVMAVHLMRSHLGGGPARYASLAEISLMTPTPVVAGAAR
jgi:RNA 2',3'-cyclic 3'-phosphodiesterase